MASVWLATTMAGLLLFAGFLVDGIGVVLRVRSESFSTAAGAARAGAQVIDDAAAVRGDVRIDPGGAQSAAAAYLSARGVPGTVTVEGDEVTVTVEQPADFTVLPGSLTISATATVAAVEGDEP
jgi:hypothetical protein